MMRDSANRKRISGGTVVVVSRVCVPSFLSNSGVVQMRFLLTGLVACFVALVACDLVYIDPFLDDKCTIRMIYD